MRKLYEQVTLDMIIVIEGLVTTRMVSQVQKPAGLSWT